MNAVVLRNALDALLDETGKNRTEEAYEAWTGLVQLIENTCQVQADLALVAASLLSADGSLLTFVKESLETQGKAGSKMREAIYKYLDKFMHELDADKAHKYCNNVIDTCIFAFTREESNPAKAATLLPLHCILEWQLPGPVPDAKTVAKLIKAYQGAYQRVKSLTGTVKGDILQTLGLLLHAEAQDKATGGFDHQWLLDECSQVLQAQAKARKPDNGYMAGALAGLSSALAHCQEGEGIDAQEIAYLHIKKSIQDVETLSRYHGLRAALSMLAHQAYRFKDHLLTDCTGMINKLIRIKIQHSNKDVRDRADQALAAVFHQLAQRIMSQAEGDQLQQLKQIHSHLLGQLTNVVSNPNTSSREVTVAMAGIGELAAPTQRFFGQQGVRQLLRHLTPLVQQGNLQEQIEDLVDDRFGNEIALLVALAKVLAELESADEATLQQCLHVAQRVIASYRGLWPKQRVPVRAALNILLAGLRSKPAVLQSLLPRLVSLLLTYTLRPADSNLIAGPLAVAASQSEDVEEPWVTYLHLWTALLLPGKQDPATPSRRHSTAPKLGLHTNEDEPDQLVLQQQAVYDALMQAIMDAVKTLDLEYHQALGSDAGDAAAKLTSPDSKAGIGQDADDAMVSADIGTGLTARNLADMRAYISLANFTCALLPLCGPSMFKGWSYLMTLELVSASGQHPLLSGFYRMLKVTMALTAASGLLQVEGAADPLTFEEMAGAVCKEVYAETLRGTIMACQRYKDELLEACLELLLSAPTMILSTQELISPLQTALGLGLQYPPLGTAAISALERWEVEQPQAVQTVAPHIVPLLDPYLAEFRDVAAAADAASAEDATPADDNSAPQDAEASLQGATPGKEAYKGLQSSSAAAVVRQKAARTQGLRVLQPRIQAWLGRAAGAADALVMRPLTSGVQAADVSEPKQQTMSRWDPDNKLGLAVPFPEEQTLTVWLDKTLPQVAQLAAEAPDRNTRVAGCEFLHAVTLWMIGLNARRPEGSKEADFDAPPTQFHTIMQRLFPVLLSLACTAEPVARQLFEPLIYSLVHWFTRSARRESAETIVLLEAILDGLGHERSGARRELCANAAREFLVWSAKHIPMVKGKEGNAAQKGSHASSNLNAASLLRRLFERLVNPQTYLRLGAAQAMAHCADAMGRLSDLNDVSDAFYLEALQKCVSALRVLEHDAEGSGTKSAMADALAALVKVPLRRTHLADSIRKGRADRQGFVDLAAFLQWLWPMTAVPERYCRGICMWLMDKLALLQMEDAMQTDNAKSPVATWFQWQLQQTGGDEEEALHPFLTVQIANDGDHADDDMSLAQMRLWLQAVEASVAWSSWALQQGLITAAHLTPTAAKPPKRAGAKGHHKGRAVSGEEADRQGVVPALVQFLGMLPKTSGPVAEGLSVSALAGCERDCAKLAAKTLVLLQQVLGQGVFAAELSLVHNLLLAALFFPGLLGMAPAEVNTAKRLAIKAKEVIQQLCQTQPEQLPALQSLLEDYLGRVIGHLQGQDRLLVTTEGQGLWQWGADLAAASRLLQGLTLAADLALPQGQSLIPSRYKAELPERFLALAAGTPAGAAPQQHMAAEGALNLALRLGIPTKTLLHHLMQSATFYESYRAVIHGWVIFNATACCPVLCEALAGQQEGPLHTAQVVLSSSLESLQRSKAAQGRADPRQRSFMTALLAELPRLASPLAATDSSSTDSMKCKTLFLQLLGRLLGLDSKLVLDTSQPAFSFVFKSYLGTLAVRKPAAAAVQLRVEALQLLAHFLDLPDDQLTVLSETVSELVTDVFPASSWEWKRGSTQSTDYARQLMALMDSIVAAAEQGRPVQAMLQALLPILREMGDGKGHARQDALVTRLALIAAAPWKYVTVSAVSGSVPSSPSMPEMKPYDQAGTAGTSAAEAQATSLFDFVRKQVFDQAESPSALRRVCLRYVLLPCLRYAPQSFQQETLKDLAKTLLDIIGDKYAPTRTGEEDALLLRTSAYGLLQFVYERFGVEDIKHQVLGPVGGEQVNMTILKAATRDFRGLPSDEALAEAAREARCAAFACGASLVLATQEKESIFAIPLKGANNSDPSGPWKQLLDTSKDISFSVEVDDSRRAAYRRASSSVKAVTDRIRRDRVYASSMMMAGTLGPFAGSIGGFASQAGSLGAKVSASQYSLGDAMLDGSQGVVSSSVPNTFQQSLDADAAGIGDWQDQTATPLDPGQEEDSLSIIDDELDSHDCMLPIIHLVEKAAALFQASHTQPGGAMPEWMKRMHDAVASGEVPRYARLFLVKVVLHVDRRHAERQDAEQADADSPQPSVFGCFAKDWFPAIMSTVLGTAEQAAEQGIHYLLLDACLMCLSWPDLFPAAGKAGSTLDPQVKLAADSLMDYLIRGSYNAQRAIVNNNFNLIKAFIHHWRAQVPLPLPALMFLLGAVPATSPGATPDARAKRHAAEQRCIGMKLLAAGLVYGQAQALMTNADFKPAVQKSLDCLATKGGQMLAQQSGECLGVVLAQMHTKAKQGVQLSVGWTAEELEKEVKRILLNAQGSGQHDRFIYSLERLTAFYKPLVDSLQGPIMNGLAHVTGMLQSLLLESLLRRAAQLPGLMTQLKPLLPSLLASHNYALQHNALQLIRVLLPEESDDAAGALFQQLVAFVQHSSTECRQQYFEILRAAWQLRPALHAVLRPPLLAMLGDPDGGLRAEALTFWDAALPKSAGLRLQALLQDGLDQPAELEGRLEAQWAQSAAALLLELPKGQRGYQAALFDRELAECKFAEYPINTDGKATLEMAPLFSPQWSASQDASQPGASLGFAGPKSPGSQALSGTQYTQARPGMVRATVGATMSQSISLTLPREDTATLGFTQGTSTPRNDTLSEHAVVRRRFNKSAGRTNEILGRLQRRRAAAGAQAVARERKVSLMRKYRTGELPDVQQLSVAAFLGPLGVMATRDATMARITLEALWTSTVASAQEGPTKGKAASSPDMTQGLRNALRKCFDQNPKDAAYVSCLQSFALADRGFTVDVQKAAKAVEACASVQAGALQLEEQMLFGSAADTPTPPNKRRAISGRAGGGSHPVQPSSNADAAAWGALAGLYEQLSQDDIVQVIYAKHLTRCPGSQVAIQALASRKVDTAYRVFCALLEAADGDQEGSSQPQAMDTDDPGSAGDLNIAKLMGGGQPLKEEEDMWFQQQNRCAEALGMWEEVLTVVNSETGGDDARLFVQEENWDGTQYLRPFVRACLFQSTEQERLNRLMQQAAGNARMTDLLEAEVAVEVAAQAAACCQWDRCRAQVTRGWVVFRQKWGALHPLSRARRFEALASLQPLTELQEVLDLLDSIPAGSAGTAGIAGLQKLVQQWQTRWPSVQQPSADPCLTVINVRQLLLNALLQEWPRNQKHRGQTLYEILKGLQGDVTLAGAAALAQQGFLDTAQDLLTQHRAAVGASHIPSLQAQLQLRIAQLDANPGTPWLYSDLSRELEDLSKLDPAAKPKYLDQAKLLQNCKLLLVQATAHQHLAQQVEASGESSQGQQAHVSAALKGYEAACKLDKIMLLEPRPSGLGESLAEAALKLALLCKELLQEEDESDRPLAVSKAVQGDIKKSHGSLSGMLVHHLLQAMRLGGSSGKEAQLLFSSLLAVLGTDQAAQGQFAEGWTQVPLHMLLPWAAQMLSLLDGPTGDALLPLLQALAKQYPQQMYFPFQLSSLHYGPEGQGRAQQLQPLLQSPLMQEWGAALNDITYPEQRWQGWSARLASLFAAGNKEEAGALYKSQVYPDMISNHVRSRGSSRAAGAPSPPATVNSVFAAKFDSKFKEAFGSTGDKVATMATRDFGAKCEQVSASIRKEGSGATGKRDLARLSHWFEAFSERAGSGGGRGDELLMPAMPSVQGPSIEATVPVHVAGFGKVVDVFSSKQRPKKLTIYGDDFKKYEWIVKGGEELRIDQRIEQLFDIMNGLMQRQPGAAAHNLAVQTYDVVPMSPSLGMVAFVPGTKPLKAVMTDPVLVPEASVAAADAAFSKFITAKGSGCQNVAQMYEKMFKVAGRREVVANFQEVQSLVRWDSLREALLRAAGSPELFLSMRASFTASLAAVSMAGYIAGVGDRHTDNYLLDLTSGTLVPIDFGYSFGTAVQVLPIPELMPFRLTRQMVGVLQPHDALAMLQAPCTLAMTALRSGRDILQGIMEVFMREPLLDWQREARTVNAKRSTPRNAADATSSADAAAPEDAHVNLKVDNARRKLEGDHPVAVMLAELTAKHAGKPHWQALQEIVKGDAKHSVRATYSQDQLSIEEQVQSVLDQATDPNILGRTWLGWKPWL